MDDLPAYTPQAISDILPIYRPENAASQIRIYKLRQASACTQTLTLHEGSGVPAISYEIKTHKTGGFMNRKPHIVISARNFYHPLAEGRFDPHGTGTSIAHFNPRHIQRLELENSQVQLLKTTIHGCDHWWQPHPGNKSVLELTNEMEEIVARFIFAVPESRRTGSVAENKKDGVGMDLGELQVVDALAGRDTGRDEILSSAVVVVERARRRAMSISGAGSKGPAA
jgi:hypothetical protein